MAQRAKIGDEAVLSKTGKPPEAWFKLLDRWGAAKKTHPEIARYLAAEHGLSSWWSQMLTVLYERARNKRKVHQRATGFEIGVSRIIAAPAKRVYAAFTEPAELSRWFTHAARGEPRVGGRFRNGDGDSGEYLALQPPKRVRFTWENAKHSPGSIVEVVISPKDRGRVTASLTHSRIKSAREAEDLKKAWRAAMDALRDYVES